MANRLEPLDLVSFVGGLNLRRNQFQLADNESPDMLNIDVDPRGGFYTRQGWQRWNISDIVTVTSPTTWQPRNGFVHDVSTVGLQYVLVANHDGEIYSAADDGLFTNLSTLPSGVGSPHIADFASWGDALYIALGAPAQVYTRTLDGPLTALDVDDFSEIDTPNTGTFPSATYLETHGGFMWCADTQESGIRFPNRVRWSHPGVPDAWRADDFIDIDIGGGRITGLKSYSDHLLVFKTTGIFKIYGYDGETQQLDRIPGNIGCPSVTAITSSSNSVFFYSTFEGGGIFAYTGGQPVLISEALRPAFEEMHSHNEVFVSWAGRRLWVAVPWHKDEGEKTEPTTLFVWDQDVGNGAWTMYRSNYGAVATVLDGVDTEGRFPLACFWSPNTAAMVTLDFTNDAFDSLLLDQTIGVTPGSDPLDSPDYMVTGGDDEIVIGGGTFQGQDFDSYYRTRWLHAGWPDRKKSWRRPTFVAREVPRDVDVLVEVYRDYNESRIYRSRTLRMTSEGGVFWSEHGFDAATIEGIPGFDWSEEGAADPRGADWGSAEKGSRLIRGGSLGAAKAVQMKIRASGTSPRRKWGMDAIVAKIVMRRFR